MRTKKTYKIKARLLHPMLGQYPRDDPRHPMYGKKDVFESYLEKRKLRLRALFLRGVGVGVLGG